MAETFLNEEYLRSHPKEIFVFGDNTIRIGKGGAAQLRDEPNTYGFITKVLPANSDSDFYTPETYKKVFEHELKELIKKIVVNKEKTYLISKLGAGLANKFHIWEEIICEGLEILKKYDNVRFLYEEEDK